MLRCARNDGACGWCPCQTESGERSAQTPATELHTSASFLRSFCPRVSGGGASSSSGRRRPTTLTRPPEMLRDPKTLESIRDEIQSRRDADANGTNEAAARWNTTYPADVRVFVRQEPEHFLAESANVDLSIPVTLIRNPAGVLAGFVAPIDTPPASWIEAECMMAGKEMVTAAVRGRRRARSFPGA